MVESSGDDMAAPGIHEGSEIGMVGSNSGEEDKVRVDEGERGVGGKRWPRQETLALLKIRSDMDAVFRDSSLKGPLWEEVSRKLGELGYHRSAKKCKEKFENVYKYHKRTKDGRTSKTDGKTYKFFDELEALGNLHSLQATSPPKPQTPIPIPTNNYIHVQTNPTVLGQANVNPTIVFTQAVPLHSVNPYSANTIPSSNFHNFSSNLFSTSTSSSTASDVDSDREASKRKRKWKVFFRRLTKKVVQKEEELQNKFLQTIERCEQERTAREEAWRVQEMARINREHEILVQERSTAAAKDAAMIAFLQKMLGQQTDTVQVPPRQTPPSHQPQPPPPQVAAPLPLLPPPLNQPQPLPPTQTLNFDIPKMTNIGENNNPSVLSSPSRWPKAEVEALINLRTNLDVKYQENLPKAPLWEEISAGMKKLGYNRSSKRCKEKWENINKYFKKVKESNKKRPEDSKTCPYFHQLDAIYRERSIRNENPSLEYGVNKPADGSSMVPLRVQPEQQWPPLPQQQQAEEAVRGNVDQIQEDDDDEEDDIGESEEEYEGNDFELVANKTAANAMDTAK